MSLIPGVGYKSAGSKVYWVKPGEGLVGTTNFNPSAPDPFSGGLVDIFAFRSRYGADTLSGRYELPDGTICLFPVDAESIGILMRAMELAAKSGNYSHEFTGKSSTHTMVPTHLEAHDYAATHSDGGRGLMRQMNVGGSPGGSGGPGATGSNPGRPRIEKATSPSPGVLYLEWITSQADEFEIKVETQQFNTTDFDAYIHKFPDPKQGNTRRMTFNLPDHVYGLSFVQIRAYRGGRSGTWSVTKAVRIEKRDSTPPSDPSDPPEEKNPILLDTVSREAILVLKRKGYSKEQVLDAYERVIKET